MQNIISNLTALQTTTLDAGQIFSGKKSGKLIQGYAEASAYTPTINPSYIFHESSRDIIVWFMNHADPLYVFGPTGCGKTSSIKQLAARLNYPVFEITGHGRLEFADLTGHLAVKEGNMVYEYGPLALAMRYGGLLLFNEIDLTAPEVAAGLNSILDGAPLCIAENGGELINPHPMFRFIATANTNGGGDETGLYQGTQRQNLAWLDRFTLCEMGYPAPEVEKNLLSASYTALPEEIAHKLVDYANEVRKLFMGESGNITNTIEVTFSTRTLLRWAELTLRFQPLASQGIQPVSYALDRALGYRASRETRAMLHELAQRMFPIQNTTKVTYTKPKPQPQTTKDINQWKHYVGLLAAADLTKVAQLPIVALEKPTNSGGKFWQAELQPDGVLLRWGKMHTNGQQLFIERDKCKQRDPAMEMIERIYRKLTSGYSLDTNNTTL